MVNPYKLYNKDCPKELISISIYEASKLVNKHNVFFTHYTDGYDLTYQDLFVYQLDPLLSFDIQHSQIKCMNGQFRTIVFYYTDYRNNDYFQTSKLKSIINELRNKNIKITPTSLKKHTQLGMLQVKAYLENLTLKLQPTLF